MVFPRNMMVSFPYLCWFIGGYPEQNIQKYGFKSCTLIDLMKMEIPCAKDEITTSGSSHLPSINMY